MALDVEDRAPGQDHRDRQAQAVGPQMGREVTARIAGLKARVAFASGLPDEARLWMAKGMNAPQEPDWSDLDPEGRAFAYHASDWARLVITFAETGALIHPRHERTAGAADRLGRLRAVYRRSRSRRRQPRTGALFARRSWLRG